MPLAIDTVATATVDGTTLSLSTGNLTNDGFNKFAFVVVWTTGDVGSVTPPSDGNVWTQILDNVADGDGGYWGQQHVWGVECGTDIGGVGGGFTCSSTGIMGTILVFKGGNAGPEAANLTLGNTDMFHASSGTTKTQTLTADSDDYTLEIFVAKGAWHDNSNGGGTGMTAISLDADLTTAQGLTAHQSAGQGRQAHDKFGYRVDGVNENEAVDWTWAAPTAGHYPNLLLQRWSLVVPFSPGDHWAWG